MKHASSIEAVQVRSGSMEIASVSAHDRMRESVEYGNLVTVIFERDANNRASQRCGVEYLEDTDAEIPAHDESQRGGVTAMVTRSILGAQSYRLVVAHENVRARIIRVVSVVLRA